MSHECRGSGTRRHRPTCCAVIFIVHDRACACRTRLLLLLLLLLLLMLRLLLLLLFGTCVVAHTAHEKEHAAPRRVVLAKVHAARETARLASGSFFWGGLALLLEEPHFS